jgi:electron-transferring-flavoprotein dehydrogenase
VTVGGGPAGLSAAIRLKQLNPDISVCVVEKGADLGAHVLSGNTFCFQFPMFANHTKSVTKSPRLGNVFETRGLDELLPNWKELGAPISTKVTEDAFLFLTEDKSVQIPNALLPPQLVRALY